MNPENPIKYYREFCKAEGNQHIASEFSILKIQELIEYFEIKSVLEIGLGIGAISGSLLSVNPELNYWGTEKNEFCLNALNTNLKSNYKRINIVKGLNAIPDNNKFDLVIIDGKELLLENLRKYIESKGIIVIEGDRKIQQKELQHIFATHHYVHSISLERNGDYSPFPSQNWQGGLKIIFIEPNLKQKIWWISEKIKTKFKYFYRKVFK